MSTASAPPIQGRAGSFGSQPFRGLPTKLTNGLLPVTGLIAVAVAWQIVTVTGIVPASVAPTFTETLKDLGRLCSDPGFWKQVWLTGRSWAIGLGLSAALAIPFGILLGVNDRAYRFFRIPVESLRPVPPIVVLPLALLLFGGDMLFKIVLISQGVIWPLLIQTVYGVRTTDPVALDTAKIFGVDPLRRILLIRLPAAAPMIATGLRLAAATAFGVTIVTELVGGAPGLGQILIFAQSANDITRVYAVTIFTGVAGVLITTAFYLAERRLLRWRPREGRS